MAWRLISIALYLAGLLAMPVWPYAYNWSWFAPVFCWFVGTLALLISVFARRGSEIWKNRGQG